MNAYFLLAFVAMPVFVVVLGYLSLLLLDRRIRRHREQNHAE